MVHNLLNIAKIIAFLANDGVELIKLHDSSNTLVINTQSLSSKLSRHPINSITPFMFALDRTHLFGHNLIV